MTAAPGSFGDSKRLPDFDLVLFGGTGDLAMRKLLPALFRRYLAGQFPPRARILGIGRSNIGRDEYLALVEQNSRKFLSPGLDATRWTAFSRLLDYVQLDVTCAADYARLAARLAAQSLPLRVFFLSTAPALFVDVCRNLAAASLVTPEARIVLEKPLGQDRASAERINEQVGTLFPERQIYRIDHYLGKEAVQNLLALRFANTLFEPLWNKVSIEHVQITVAETIGVEDRWSYYDQYGAIRDMVQNHLLQLLALVAMEPPADPDSVRDEKVKVLRSLRPITDRDVERNTVRGQYTGGVSGRQPVPGYTEETGGRASSTETFVALCAHIDNWRWAGAPFYLRTGKRLPSRKSEIIIQFRGVPHSIFPGNRLLANRLIIKLQPEEEIALTLMNKTPSLARNGMELKPLALNLSLSDAFKPKRRRIAYERLLLEALANKPTLFVRRDESEAAWSWIDQIVASWKQQGDEPAPYASGTWGPAGAFALTERNGHSWYE